jgi:MYXO-CTERM domain-containing protein
VSAVTSTVRSHLSEVAHIVGTGGLPRWIGRVSGVAVASIAIMAAGCAAETTSGDDDVRVAVRGGSVDPTIFGGALDDDDAAIPGVVALRVGQNGSYELCSGALLAPNVVLTARHCVTKNLTTSVSCDENGASANGKHVEGDEDPTNIAVYVGASPRFSETPHARAKAVVAPHSEYLCNSDIAIVVLDKNLVGVEPLAVRLGANVSAGETIRAVGYGMNDGASPLGTRYRKEGVNVLAKGSAISASKTPLGGHEFEVSKSICQGDSGGPAISEETGAVIGVVSRGGGCEDNYGHIYTTTSGFEDMFDQAFALANAAPIGEGTTPAPMKTKTVSGTLPPEEKEEKAASGCSAAPAGTSGSVPGTALGLALAAAFVIRARRRAS